MAEFNSSSRRADEVMSRARQAYSAWSRIELAERLRSMRALRRAITAQSEEIVANIVADTGKPPLDALGGDVLVTLEAIRYYERTAKSELKPRKVSRSRLFFAGAEFEEHLEPYGVALIFGPSNYPFQLAMVPAITALIAGNAVVLKVSERTPRTAARIAKLFAENFPAGLVHVVDATPAESAAYLEASPDMIFLTGSTAAGRFMAQKAAERMTPVVLELGGKDAALVFADAPMERTLDGLTYGAFSNGGQVCVGIKRLYVEQPVYETVLAGLIARLGRLRSGSTLNHDLGPLLGEQNRLRFRRQIEDALSRGAKLEFGSTQKLDGDEPILLSGVPADALLLQEESFGPVVCIERFVSEEQAVELADNCSFGLAASIWTRDLERAKRIAKQINVGGCAINDVIRQVANPAAAFGGNKSSGLGRYHGSHGLRAFSKVKTILLARSSRRREINWFPFTATTYRQLNALLQLRHGAKRAWLKAWRGLLPVLLLLCMAGHAQAQGAHLKIAVVLPPKVHGGQIAYLVFSSAEGFPSDVSKARLHGFVPLTATTGTVTIDAGALPPGQYAASVYLDENNNHKLDAGFLGIPREPVGVSNNPKPRMGPPRYSDSIFTMDKKEEILTIKLVRP